jgi:hypothetical protein
MIDQNKIDEKEARLLAEKEAQKYGFGSGEINEVLNACGTDKECIKRKFSEIANRKIQDTVNKFQQGNGGLEPS